MKWTQINPKSQEEFLCQSKKEQCHLVMTKHSRVAQSICRLLEISRSGYYAWKNRSVSARKLHEQKLLRILISLHERYPAAGLDTLAAMIRKECPCSRNTVHRLMKLYNIHSIRKRAFKITTNSKHNYAVSPNLLKRDLAVAENFFSCLKCELVHHKHYKTRSEAQADIFAYIEAYYNSVRPQSTLNWLSPLAYEHMLSIYAAKVA